MRSLAAGLLFAQLLAAGDIPELLTKHCAGCHGSDARGSGKGPGLAANPHLAGQSIPQLQAAIRRGFPDSGMPPFELPAAQLEALARYVRDLNAVVPPAAANGIRPVTWRDPQPGDWLTYNGSLSANRYSELKQINTANVAALRLKWLFPIPYFGPEVTPLKADGVMYVTGPHQVYAIDALTGAEIWKYSRPRTPDLAGDATLGTNRGVAIRDNKVFLVTDNAHLIALDRATGELLWRRWTVPRRGEPGSESTWLTGSYDPATDTLFWPTGNPFPDSEDADRGGDNLYTDSILALNPPSGSLRWHYHGAVRKLLLHADRNGFFYVLDRVNGRVVTGQAISAARRLALDECVGNPMGYPDQTGQRYLRAVNIETGAVIWEVAQPGPAKAKSWSGVLATAGGLVFYGKPNVGFDAVDERSGKTLSHFPTNVRMKASPMTFRLRGKQYVAVAAGPNILCFGV